MDKLIEGLGGSLAQTLAAAPYLASEIFLFIFFALFLLADLVIGPKREKILVPALVGGFSINLYLLAQGYFSYQESIALLGGGVYLTKAAFPLKMLFSVCGIFACFMMEFSSKGNRNDFRGEKFSALLGMALGLQTMVMASNLLYLYIAIETVSLSSYVLVAMGGGKKDTEAGIKYLIFGAVSSAVMLYGMSMLYGLTGSLDYSVLSSSLKAASVAALFFGTMTLAGMLFKLGAVPFHLWAPDVYAGASTPVAALLSTAPKIGGLGALSLFCSYGGFFTHGTSLDILAFLALIGILFGNFGALLQKEGKRMMAYSSIAHAGFLIAAVLGAQYSGTSSLVYYAASFVFFNFMAFAGIQFLEQKAGSGDLEKFRGLGASNVLLGIAMLVSMIALAGLPPTSGFTAKLLVFTDLFWLYKIEDSPVLLWLFVLGLANIVVSLFYYLKIPYLMFFKKASGEEKAFVVDTWRILLWAILSVMTLLPFFWPKVFLW